MINKSINYIYEQELIQIVIFAVGIYHVAGYLVDFGFSLFEKIYGVLHKLV